jgi:hypothetical protein
VTTFFVLADSSFFLGTELFFFVTTDFWEEGFLVAAFFEETVAFFNDALLFVLAFEEAFTAFPFFAAAELLEEEAGLDFMATDFFFKAFFRKGLGDDLRTGFFLAMQSPFYEIV